MMMIDMVVAGVGSDTIIRGTVCHSCYSRKDMVSGLNDVDIEPGASRQTAFILD